MKAVIVSDSHGRFGAMQEIIEKESPFDMFLHAGDLQGSLSSLEDFAGVPVFAVRGNCDMFSSCEPEQVVAFGSHRIFLTHGHRYGVRLGVEELAGAAAARGCDIAVFGHTHIPQADERYGVTVLNPGSISEPRQKNARPTYMVLETVSGGGLKWEIKYFE